MRFKVRESHLCCKNSFWTESLATIDDANLLTNLTILRQSMMPTWPTWTGCLWTFWDGPFFERANCMQDLLRCDQGCTNRCSLAAGLRGNGERMRKWGGNGEKIRKWREIDSLHFLILSLFPPSFSISSLSFHFLHQNASHFVAKC